MSKLDPNLLSGVELPPARTSSGYETSVPMFCTKCEEIRGNFDGGTIMQSAPEILAWKSFGMCSSCYHYARTNPEQVVINMRNFKQRQVEKEQDLKRTLDARRFRVYFLDENPRLSNSSFVNTLSDVKFNRFAIEQLEECKDWINCPTFFDKCNCVGASFVKSRDLVDEETAKTTVKLIRNKLNVLTYYVDEGKL